MNKQKLTKKVRADFIKAIEFSLDKLKVKTISERVLKKEVESHVRVFASARHKINMVQELKLKIMEAK